MIDPYLLVEGLFKFGLLLLVGFGLWQMASSGRFGIFGVIVGIGLALTFLVWLYNPEGLAFLTSNE